MIKPFYEPEPGDLIYCKQLSEWWKTVEKKRTEGYDAVAQCVSVSTRKTSHRIHRLISETDHESEPGGYFDCTVQVTLFPTYTETSYLRAFGAGATGFQERQRSIQPLRHRLHPESSSG